MNIKTWVLNKLVSPIIPVLKQTVVVLDIVLAKIDSTLQALETLGIKIDGTVLNNIRNATSAISIVRTAIVKVLSFVGETFGIRTQFTESLANADLEKEIENLKKLI